MSHPYAWTAHLRDGSAVSQLNADGVDDGCWANVDAANVSLIRLDPGDSGLPVQGVLVPEGATAFLTVRRTQELDPNTGEQFAHPGLLIAGWSQPDGASAYLFVDADGNGLCAATADAI